MDNLEKKITKVILLTTWRSGSTFIRVWLNSHKTNRIHSEIFLRHYKASDGFKAHCEAEGIRRCLSSIFGNSRLTKSKYNFVMNNIVAGFLDELFYSPTFSGAWSDMDKDGAWKQYQPRENIEQEKVIGFQLMYSQLNEYRFLQHWIETQNVSIIHLIRENALKLLLSRIKALETTNWQFASNKVKQKTFLDPRTVLEELDKIVKEREKMKKRFPKNKYLEISYEQFINNYSNESKKIFDFLKLKDTEMSFSRNLKKLNPDSLNKVIKNYDEISIALKGTPYQDFLN